MHWKHFLGFPEYFQKWILKMNSEWRNKIWICSVILGELESFLNNVYKGLSIIFPKTLDAILSFTKERIFLPDSSLQHILNQEILDLLFRRKIALLEDWNAKNWT